MNATIKQIYAIQHSRSDKDWTEMIDYAHWKLLVR